ncbi:MAG: CarD family transcriptional regulator [Dongiaceae bacterium]
MKNAKAAKKRVEKKSKTIASKKIAQKKVVAKGKIVPMKAAPKKVIEKMAAKQPVVQNALKKNVVIKPTQAANVNKPLKDKALPFAANDYVVYPTHGVGLVKGIETQEIAGHNLRLFVVEIQGAKMTVKVPLGKIDSVGLRRVSSRKEMQGALERLKAKAKVRRTMWSRRAQEYEQKINSGDPIAIAEVVRELYRSATQPDQSYSERQIFQQALERLAREYAAVERIDEQAASDKLQEMLKAA